MGTWDYGLLDNDSASDELNAIFGESMTAVRDAASRDLTPERAGRLAAQLALVVHYHLISDEDTEALEMRAGIERNRAVLLKVAPKASAILGQIERDEVPDDPKLAPLFEAKHAAAYLQSLADEAVDEVEMCLEEQRAGAHLDVLTIIAPYVELRMKTVKHIARRVRELTGDAEDEEGEYFDAYAKACKTLLKHAAASADGDDDDEGDD